MSKPFRTAPMEDGIRHEPIPESPSVAGPEPYPLLEGEVTLRREFDEAWRGGYKFAATNREVAGLLAEIDRLRDAAARPSPAEPPVADLRAAEAAREFIEWWDSPPHVIADDDVLEERVGRLRAAVTGDPTDPTHYDGRPDTPEETRRFTEALGEHAQEAVVIDRNTPEYAAIVAVLDDGEMAMQRPDSQETAGLIVARLAALRDPAPLAAEDRGPIGEGRSSDLVAALAEGIHKAMCFGPAPLHNRLACERGRVYWNIAEVSLGHPAMREFIDVQRRNPPLAASSPTARPSLDGERLQEVRRLLGYLWTAEGKIHGRQVSSLFDDDDPLVADVKRLAIFPETDA